MSDPRPTQASGASFGWLFSLIGVLVMFVLVLAVNFIAKRTLPLKADLTEDKIYTLSDGTKEILGGMDTKVTVTFFASDDDENVHPALLEYKPKVDALLETYRRTAKGGLLEVKRLNPEPDSKAEELAQENQLSQLTGRFDDPVYFGLTVSCLDRVSTVPFMQPGRERTLEYDISRAILEVTRESAPEIGYISAFEIAGQPAMPPQRQGGGQPEWHLHRVMSRDYDPDPSEPGSNFTRLEPDLEVVPDNIDVLFLLHPAGLSESTQYAIDQFLLRGGRIVAFLDSHSQMAEFFSPQQQPQFGQPPMPGIPTSSNLDKLLPAWGIEFEDNLVLADAGNMGRQWWRRNEPNPGIVRLTSEGVSEDDSLTRDVRDLQMVFPGAFYVDEREGLDTATIAWSTDKSELVDRAKVTNTPHLALRDFKPSGKEYPVAVRLKGKFTTAFPQGKPTAEDEGDEEKEGDETEETEETEEEKDDSLKESKADSLVILFADSDMLFDAFSMDRRGEPINQNLALVLSAVEQAAGGSNLMSIRSRASTSRPFTKFKEMEAEASKEYNEELGKLADKQQEVQNELNKMFQDAMAEQQGQTFIQLKRSPELEAKEKELQAQIKESKKRTSELRRELRRDVQKIKSRIELANIMIMPVIVVLIGIAHLIIRRRKMSAR